MLANAGWGDRCSNTLFLQMRLPRTHVNREMDLETCGPGIWFSTWRQTPLPHDRWRRGRCGLPLHGKVVLRPISSKTHGYNSPCLALTVVITVSRYMSPRGSQMFSTKRWITFHGPVFPGRSTEGSVISSSHLRRRGWTSTDICWRKHFALQYPSGPRDWMLEDGVRSLSGSLWQT